MFNPRLRVVYWNAQTLTGKTNLLREFLRQQNVDVMLICETLLQQTAALKISGYIVYRQDEVNLQGHAYRGLAVIVRRNVIHQPIEYVRRDSLYALGIDLNINGRDLRLYAIYRPPGPVGNLKREVEALLNSDMPTILAGDWNAKHPDWHASTINPAGRTLHQAALDHDFCTSGPGEPTRYGVAHGSEDVLDFVIHKNVQAAMFQEVLPDLPSDHRPVLLTLEGAPAVAPHKQPRKRIDWEIFSTAMEERTQSNPIHSADDVEEAANSLSSNIREAIQSAAQTTSPKGRLKALPARLRDLIERKRQTRRRWQTTRCPTLRTTLNALTERVKKELQDFNHESWESHIAEIGDDVPSIHRLCRQLGTTRDAIQPLQDAQGNPKYKAEDRAEIFAAHLETQFTPNPVGNEAHADEVSQHLIDYLAAPLQPNEDPIFFTPGQIQRALKRCNPKKAPGADEIPNMALRHLPQRSIAAVTRLFNGIMRTAHYPTTWKLGRIIMIPKPGKSKKKPESYRPITLLSTLSKVFERLLLGRLLPHVEPRPEQFGFRAEHSTTLQLTRVLAFMTEKANRGEYTVATMLDMEKAFDRVWHEGLLYKLSLTQTPRRIVYVIRSYLTNRCFQVAVEDALSAVRPIRAGVPQGSCLSPACYAIYTDDIPVVDDVKLGLFADDAAFYVHSMNAAHAAKKMQRQLDVIPDWLKKWRLAVNVSKTQALLTGQTQLPPKLKLQGEAIDWQPHVKYLGVIIDRRLTMKHHIKHAVNRAKAARTLLQPVLRSNLKITTKLGIVKTYIRSRLTYAAPAWYALAAETNKKKLRSQENRALRSIVKAPRYVRNKDIQRDLKWENLDAFIGRLTGTMFARADRSRHQQLQGIAPLHARPPDRRTRALARELIPQN